MDGREVMALTGSASYYLNRGGIVGSGGSGTGTNAPSVVGGSGVPQTGSLHTTPGPRTSSNPNFSMQPHVGLSGSAVSGSSFHVENPSPNFPHGSSMPMASSVSPTGQPGKKKRGRPRKYGPDGSNMSLGLSPTSRSAPSSGALTSGEKPRKGRPPGSGWKQRLAPLGDWMNSSAGLAFTPHVLNIGVEEDIAAKVLAFAQQRPRALCILSATGSVSSVTLRPPTNSGATVTYEGRFEILCLSGSYLVAETGGPPNRTGGLSISFCSPDGQMIGGAIGGKLIASSPVQVVVCSFVYGGSKAKTKIEAGIKDEKNPGDESAERSSTPASAAPAQNLTPSSATSVWPPSSQVDMKNPETDIDLMRG